MKRLTTCLILFLLGQFAFSAQNSVTFYVAQQGKDTNPGTLEKPFATPERARDAVRAALKTNTKESFTLIFRKGSYVLKKSLELNSHDSGSENATINYCAYPGEEVSFTGGITIPVEKAKIVKEKSILARLVPEAKGKILQINLKALGINNFGKLMPRGFGRPYQPAPMELFCNKEAMRLARWPNDSLVPIGKVLDQGSIPRDGDYSNRGGKFAFDVVRPERWRSANDIWISGFFRYGYADDAVKVANMDFTNKTITTAQATMYGFGSGKVFQRWYAYNLLEEIDLPGEYYIDRSNGMLYFYPPDEALRSIELSVLEDPLVVLENVSNTSFNDIIFECSRGMGMYMERGRNNSAQNCIFRNLGMVAVSIGKGVLPFTELRHAGAGTPASRVLGSILAYSYENTTFNREAGTGHLVSGCHIYNTGSGGVSLGGGDRLTLEKGNNRIENCRIHDFNRLDRSYKVGINIDGVGNVIRNCEIYNSPGSAILLHGNDHLIELNNIHHAVIDGDDMGAIYYGRDPSERGHKVLNNFFHHIGNEHGMIMAVYHDDGACGMEVTGNIFYKAGSRTVMIGGGQDNVYRNNLFIDCPLAFHLDNRQQGWAKGNLEKGGIFEIRLKAVNYNHPPYSKAYPELGKYLENSPALPQRNYIDNNVFVNVKMIHNGSPAWSYIGKCYIACGDPGFVDADQMNFEIKPTSDIFKLLPGFKAIPFNLIGLHKDNKGVTR